MRFWFKIMSCLGVTIAGAASGGLREKVLTVGIDGLASNRVLPARAAFCAAEGTDPAAHNISPAVRWSKGPAATRSYVLLMADPDVPANLTQIDQPGVTIAADAPRQAVYHWVLVDIPTSIHRLRHGADGDGLVPHGKSVGTGPIGVRGTNVYTEFLRNVPSMAGIYGGYDGPCPPKNDARTHRYIVTIYALNVATINLTGAFDGKAVERAMADHILARGSATALYLNGAKKVGPPGE